DVGTVLAWRHGEARLRDQALVIARRLRPRLCLDALGLSDWPEAATSLALGALELDSWHHPRTLFTKASTDGAAGAEDARALLERHQKRSPPPISAWTLVQRIGDFTGFGGQFPLPPVVLDGGSRHELWAECDRRMFRIFADLFGHVACPEPSPDV